MASMLDIQHDAILKAIRDAGRGQWKVLVIDEKSSKLIYNVVKEDEILNERITNIEQIEHRRTTNREMEAVYFLSPDAHIVECLIADLERKRYAGASLLWTSLLKPALRAQIDNHKSAKAQIRSFNTLDISYYPRESHLVTFRDPYSFPVLYHPQCNNLVRDHLNELAQNIVAVCVSLGEYPTIRYHKPQASNHEAAVLCSHLAKFVQDQIDMYATYHNDFPPPSPRPRGTLYILDRSMDLVAPLVHEFTYQSMIHDLLPIREGERITYKVTTNAGDANEETKELAITEKDKLWLANRHQHMKDTIEKLMGEFQKFLDANPHFASKNASDATNLNAIKDMMAGLPQFQEMKEAYSLHLTMAQDAMNVFQKRKLPDVASIEQTLATGLDEEYKKPRNVTDQVVRLLDEDDIILPDRLRLLALYILFRDGILPADTSKLMAHAGLQSQEGEVIRNLTLLGARTARPLKDTSMTRQPLFPQAIPGRSLNPEEDYSLSRFQTALKQLLDEHCRGSLNQETFPFTKPQLDPSDGLASETAQASLRSGAKPTWARTRTTNLNEPRQRVIVFMAGGATYSEARACYETTKELNKDVYLLTSHMLTPGLFLRQVGDLSMDKRKLGIPAEQPKPQAPAHLFEPEPVVAPPQQPVAQPQPTQQPQSSAPAQPRSHQQSQPAQTSRPPTTHLNTLSIGEDARPSTSRSTVGSMLSSGSNKNSSEKSGKDGEKKKKLFGLLKK